MYKIVYDINNTKTILNVIVSNRLDSELEECKEFIYSRDIFSRD
jgi:hypothetical protein